MHERRLVRFLDSVKEKASAIYLLGVCSTFGRISLRSAERVYTFSREVIGINRYGRGNSFLYGYHDIWTYGYLEQECGLIVHRKPITTEIYGKEFYLAHGDGLGDPNVNFKISS